MQQRLQHHAHVCGDKSFLIRSRKMSGSRRCARRNGSVSSTVAFAAASCLLAANEAAAHGFVGKRFFPATLATDDPFIADELSLPTISYFKTPANGDEPATRQTDFSLDVSKRITDNFGIAFGASYLQLRPEQGETPARL